MQQTSSDRLVAGSLHAAGWLWPSTFYWAVWIAQAATIAVGAANPPQRAFISGLLVGAIGIACNHLLTSLPGNMVDGIQATSDIRHKYQERLRQLLEGLAHLTKRENVPNILGSES